MVFLKGMNGLWKAARKRAFHLRHIRSKLLFSYVAILILPCMLLGYGFLHVFDGLLVRERVQDVEKETLVLSENIKFTINGLGEILRDFCRSQDIWQYFYHVYTYPETSIKGYYDLIRPTLNSYIALHPEILQAVMYTLNDTVVTNESEIRKLNEGTPEYGLYERLQHSSSTWTLDRIELDGKKRLVAARIVSLYQRHVGLFLVQLDPVQLNKFIGKNNAENTATIVSHEGTVAFSNMESLIGQTFETTPLAPALAGDKDDTVDFTLNGQQVRAIIVPFTVTECKNDWYLIQTVTIADLHKLANANKTVVALLGGAVMLCMGVFSAVFANGLARRLLRIGQGIAQVESGDFTIRVHVGGEDEVTRLAASLNHMAERLERLVNENAKMQVLQREMEMAGREAKLFALQSQINPHFLFNTLEAVQYGIKVNLPGTDEVVTLLARSLRRIASWENDVVTLDEELAYVAEHLQIQRFRYGDKLEYRLDVADGLGEMAIPRLLLQPIVENAVTHGIAMKRGKGLVHLTVTREGTDAIIAIEDDGAGMDELTQAELEQALKRSNIHGERYIGLKNVYDRIHLFYGDGRFNVESRVDIGTRVTLRLTIVSLEELHASSLDRR